MNDKFVINVPMGNLPESQATLQKYSFLNDFCVGVPLSFEIAQNFVLDTINAINNVGKRVVALVSPNATDAELTQMVGKLVETNVRQIIVSLPLRTNASFLSELVSMGSEIWLNIKSNEGKATQSTPLVRAEQALQFGCSGVLCSYVQTKVLGPKLPIRIMSMPWGVTTRDALEPSVETCESYGSSRFLLTSTHMDLVFAAARTPVPA